MGAGARHAWGGGNEHRAAVKVVTMNVLFGPENWAERRAVGQEGLLAKRPDCVLAQEAWEEARGWLSARLSMPYVFWAPYRRPSNRPGLQDGITILSRLPLLQREVLLSSEG